MSLQVRWRAYQYLERKLVIYQYQMAVRPGQLVVPTVQVHAPAEYSSLTLGQAQQVAQWQGRG